VDEGAITLAKRAQVVQIDGPSSDEQATRTASFTKEKQTLEFWQRRSKTRLTPTAAREIRKNIEGLIDLLTRWDQEERYGHDSAVRLRGTDDDAKA
jgi:hypothetical protein